LDEAACAYHRCLGRRALLDDRANGRAIAAAALARGDRVAATARNTDSLRDLVAAHPGRAVAIELDVTDRSGADAAVAATVERFGALDVLVNNAGSRFNDYLETDAGVEMTFALNHLGHFLLTGLLLPSLIAGAPSRVINLSSGGHRSSDILWDDPNYETRPYDKMQAYGQSKTANILFTRQLETLFGPKGVHAYAVHPGMIFTDLGRHMTKEDLEDIRSRAAAVPGGGIKPKPIPAGAATSVWAAVAPELEGKGGAYLEDCEISDQDAEWTRDTDAAARLWKLSEELVGQSFP
jgi:NAD(P)-dependent dehydrogenase (short-subunit alcohol dehydrogenase family)